MEEEAGKLLLYPLLAMVAPESMGYGPIPPPLSSPLACMGHLSPSSSPREASHARNVSPCSSIILSKM